MLFRSLGFSIPINNIKKAIDDFISNGKVSIFELYQRVNDSWLGAVQQPRNLDNLREIVRQAGLYGAGNRFDGIYEL